MIVLWSILLINIVAINIGALLFIAILYFLVLILVLPIYLIFTYLYSAVVKPRDIHIQRLYLPDMISHTALTKDLDLCAVATHPVRSSISRGSP